MTRKNLLLPPSPPPSSPSNNLQNDEKREGETNKKATHTHTRTHIFNEQQEKAPLFAKKRDYNAMEACLSYLFTLRVKILHIYPYISFYVFPFLCHSVPFPCNERTQTTSNKKSNLKSNTGWWSSPPLLITLFPAKRLFESAHERRIGTSSSLPHTHTHTHTHTRP